MGLFSNKCPKCGYDVSKKARICSQCGAPAPGGWWRCPNQKCNQWIGNESNFCPYCKTPTHVASREAIAGGRWQKSPDVFAERFEINDIKRLIEQGLIIEQGTQAILLDAGAYKDVLGAGSHNLDSLAHKINNWGSPPPRTVVLVDAGDVVLPLHVENLRSAEEYPLDMFAEMRLRFAEKGAVMFLENMLKDRKRLAYEELATQLKGEIWSLAQNFCTNATVADLVKDPERRLRLEDTMQAELQKVLERCGIEIIRVGAVEFVGKEYEAERARTGDLEHKRRMFEFDQRLRELAASDQMAKFKSERELEEYVNQLAQERTISAENRDHELTLLRLVHRQEIGKREADFAMVKEMAEVTHALGIKKLSDEYDRLKKVLEAEAEVQIVQMWIKVREEKLRLKRQHEEEELRIQRDHSAGMVSIFEGKNLQTLIATIPDAAQRKDLIALYEQESRRGMTAEQIMAIAAEKSPAIAEALARQMNRSQDEIRKAQEEVKQAHKESAERAERMGREGLEAAKEIGKHIAPTSNQQIIK